MAQQSLQRRSKVAFVKRLLVKFSVIILLVFALFAALVHLSTPVLMHYKPQLTSFASRTLHMPVEFRSVELTLRGITPSIEFKHASLYDEKHQKPILTMQHLVLGLDAWHSWKSKQLKTRRIVNVEADDLKLGFNHEQPTLTINKLIGSFEWHSDAKQWRLNSSDLRVRVNQNQWPRMQLAVQRQAEQNTVLISYANLKDVKPLLITLQPVKNYWQALSPSGILRKIRIQWQNEKLESVAGQFQSTALTKPKHGPLLEKISGYFKWHDKQLRLKFNEGKLHIAKHINLEQIQGEVRFIGDSIQSKQLQARLFNHPVALHLLTQNLDNRLLLAVRADGQLTVAQLMQLKLLPNLMAWRGAFPYHAEIQIPLNKNTPSIVVSFYSELTGLTVQLPKPLGKARSKNKVFSLKAILNSDDRLLDVIYQNAFTAKLHWILNQDDWQFDRGELHIGNGEPVLPKLPGLYIHGELEEVELADWLQLPVEGIEQAEAWADTFKQAQVNIKQLNFLGQRFKNVSLTTHVAEKQLLTKIDSSQVSGTLAIHGSNEMNATLERLTLLLPHKKNIKTTSLPKTNFPFHIYTKNLNIDNRQLKNVSLQGRVEAGAFKVDELRITDPRFYLQAAGDWQKVHGQDKSEIRGFLRTSKFSELLGIMQLPNVLSTKQAEFEFSLHWNKPIFMPQAKALAGQISVLMKKGEVLKLSQTMLQKIGVGKLLTFLSVDSLWRRLEFDFSDLAQSGLSFDKLSADFQLAKGIAETNDFALVGPIADLNMHGQIELDKHEVDLRLTVQPHLTSSLPVVATLADGPFAGAITYTADRFIGDKVSKISAYQYHLTGPWQQPMIKPITSMPS